MVITREEQESQILKVSKRDTVEVHLPGGIVLNGPRGCPIEDFLKIISDPKDPPTVGAVVNGELRELTYPINMDAVARPVTMGHPDGMRIYRRSLIFLLDTAFAKLFPDAILRVDHSVGSGGFYCQVLKRSPLTEEELLSLEARMR